MDEAGLGSEPDFEHDEIADLELAHDPVPVSVGGVRRFLAKPGRRGEQSAIQLVSTLRD